MVATGSLFPVVFLLQCCSFPLRFTSLQEQELLQLCLLPS
jgi:hypothetical protein